MRTFTVSVNPSNAFIYANFHFKRAGAAKHDGGRECHAWQPRPKLLMGYRPYWRWYSRYSLSDRLYRSRAWRIRPESPRRWTDWNSW